MTFHDIQTDTFSIKPSSEACLFVQCTFLIFLYFRIIRSDSSCLSCREQVSEQEQMRRLKAVSTLNHGR